MKEIYFITSAMNNTNVNQDVWNNINAYADYRNAIVKVIPITYNPLKLKKDEIVFDVIIDDVIIDDDYIIDDSVSILGTVNIRPTAKNPLTGMISLGLNHNTIIASPKLQEETIPYIDKTKDTKKIITTGSISKPNYTLSKIGSHGKFHHMYGFVIVEVENGRSFMRQVEVNEDGSFHDLDVFVKDCEITKSKTEAIILGDVHQMFLSKPIKKGFKSIFKRFNPSKVVLHDVFDAYTISHHHDNDIFRKYQISKLKTDVVQELKGSAKFLKKMSKRVEEVIVVNSNHDSHLLQYVNKTLKNGFSGSMTSMKDVVKMQWLVLDKIDNMNFDETIDPKLPDLFAEMMKSYNQGIENVTFLEPNTSRKIHDIEISFHGHSGLNGARTLGQLQNRLSTKTCSAHSHSAKRIGNWCVVGTSSNLDRNYTNGLSTWSHTHCIIHTDGIMQLFTQMPSDGRYSSDGKAKTKGKLFKKLKKKTFTNDMYIPDENEIDKKWKVTNLKSGDVYFVNGRYDLKAKTSLSDWMARTLMSNKQNGDYIVELNKFYKEKAD